MCGFAGVVAWDEKYRVSPETLRKMSARIAHRGPDGEGIYLNHEEQITPDHPQVGLVHRRLAILDLDPRANQPFTDQRGRWIVFNGEIYNFRELRGELEKLKPDYAWRTTGDTEVLLVAYDVWGRLCLDRLEGMFALAIWDESQQELFVARDRMGQKPLYVAFFSEDGGTRPRRVPRSLMADFEGSPGAVVFGSELSAFNPVGWIPKDIDPVAVVEYLKWGYVPNPLTIFEGISQVAPGTAHLFRRERKGWEGYSYFKPTMGFSETTCRKLPDRSAVAQTRELVFGAVEQQLVSDVPVGCFLSGGVDSSVVAAAMKRAARPDQKVHTFSIGFCDPRYDETKFSAAVAAHLGTDHHAFTVKPDAAADLPLLAKAFGEPFGDSSALPTHYLSRETRKAVKVAISGDGGDELFGGYDRYRAMLQGKRLRTVLTPLPWIVLRPLFAALAGGHPKSRKARATRFLGSLGLPSSARYLSYLRLFDDQLLSRLLQRESGDSRLEIDAPFPDLYCLGHIPFRSVVREALQLDRMTYLPDDLLAKVDRASMLHALEVRSPFMDSQLVRFTANLRTNQLLKGGPKRMLREAFAQDLPAWVFKRKKMGFAVPIGEWFRGELRGMLRDNLFAADSFANAHFDMKVVGRLVDEHEQERVDHSQRLYALLMLELWWREAKG